MEKGGKKVRGGAEERKVRGKGTQESGCVTYV